jgi:response regulator RpfG family c-di-GMP phosphodiesterase
MVAQPHSQCPVRKDAVLFVDDDSAVRTSFKRLLDHAKIPVDLATDGHEALAFLDRDPSGYAVVVTDFWMPGMDGVSLLRRASSIAPSATRILMSGALDLPHVMQAVNAGGIYQVISKPWNNSEMISVMRRARERASLEIENERLMHALTDRNGQLECLNSELDHQVMQRTANLLDGLISALDLRDTETQWHSRRVSAYARRLADALGIFGQEAIDIEYGALLHDIGKIGIPDAILRKPEALTEDEWIVMRTHPKLGYDLLKGIEFLKQAALVPLHHHERFDGTGYPQRLKEEQIYIGARIFSVADALDVITTNRPYRRARTFDFAREEIARCSGTQFDPAVAAAYLAISDEDWKGLQAKYLAPGET